MIELVKLAVVITFLCFALPILLYLTIGVMASLASGNFIPFTIFIVVCLWAIAR